MSRTIDQRVVEMQFDNRQFESNVATSMSTIEKLKNSLNFDGAAKGLSGISDSVRKCDMSTLGNAVETVKTKFSALEVMAVTALANITNSAVNAGKKLISSFTVEPIKAGLDEYETQINAIQTILSNTRSKGTTMDQVNDALDELNKYADKTIYNFTEMTRNIGTFTAAGVDLDTSVSAIKGIANLAAISGSNSQQASTAMYQLSQALSSGTVKLQDWNSVVNAGMGGQVFQDALKETARVHGIAIDDMIEQEGSFRETLKDGWLSSEILTETLSKFTGDLTEAQLTSMGYTQEQAKEIMALGQNANDAATKVKTFTQLMDTLKEAAQSGWTQSWELLIGDFEEAKALWTSVSDYFSDAINKSAEARNNVLQGWKDAGGRDMVIEAITNAWNGLLSIIRPVKEAFREVFPPITSQKLLELTEKVRNLTEKFKLNENQSKKLKKVFEGFFSIIKIGVNFVKSFADVALQLIGNFTGVGNGILDAAGSLGEWITGIQKSTLSSESFGNVVEKIGNFIDKVIDKIRDFASSVKEKFDLPGFEGFKNILGSIWEIISKIGSKIGEVAGKIRDAISEAFRSDAIGNGLDTINTGIFTVILLGVKDFVSNIKDTFDSAKDTLSGVTNILDGVRGCLESWQQNIKADTLMKIAIAIGLLAASITVLSLIKPEKIQTSLGAITILFTELMTAMSVFSKIDSSGSSAKSISAMAGIALSILILSSALKSISDLNWRELGVGLTGIFGLMTMVVAAMKILGSNEGTIIKGAGQMILVAAAIKVLSSACKSLSELSWEELAKGLVGVAGLLLEIGIFAKAISGTSNMMSIGAGLILVAAGVKILSSALESFGSMQWDEIGRGLVAMGGALTEVYIAIKLMPNNIASIGAGLLIAAAGMKVLASALNSFGGMSWAEIGRGLVAMGVALAELAIGLNLMTGTLAGSAALAVAAVSVGLLVPAIKSLGNMTWGEIIKGLIGMAGAFAVIGVAGLVLGPIAPIILALSGAIALLGVGLLGIGAGVMLFATAIGTLATVTAAGATAIVAALSVIVTGIADLIPTIIQKIGEGIVAFCETIANSAESIGNAIKTVFLTLVDVINECAEPVIECVLNFITMLLTKLNEKLPDIVNFGINFVLALIEGISSRIGDVASKITELIVNALNAIVEMQQTITQAGVDLIINLINGLAQGIEENTPRIKEAFLNLFNSLVEAVLVLLGIHSPSTVFANIGTNIIQGLINGVKNLSSSAVNAIKNLVTNMVQSISSKVGEFLNKGRELITNLKNGIANKVGEAKAAVSNLISNLVSTISSKVSQFAAKGRELMSNLKTGISNKISDVKSAVTNVVSNAASAIQGKFQDFKDTGKNLIGGFIDGVKEKASSLIESVKGAVSNAIDAAKNLLGINSPSKVFAEIGRYTDEGFVAGLEKYAGKVYKTSQNISKSAVDGAKSALTKIGDIASGSETITPTIRPVVDMSSVRTSNLQIGTNIAAFMDKPIDSLSQLISNAQNEINTSNNEVISAIRGLRDDLASYYSRDDSEIALYVDSKKLATSLAKPMNRQLNILSQRGAY